MRAGPSPSCLHRVTACGQLAAAMAGMETGSAGEEGAALVQSHNRMKRAETGAARCTWPATDTSINVGYIRKP